MQPVTSNRRAELHRISRWLWRRLLWWRYLLLQRRRHNQLCLEQVAGRPILVLPQVFNPRLFRTGELLAGALDSSCIPPGAAVLDLGTGSGIGAIAASRWAASVVAVDINPHAVRCARINVLLNQVEERVEVYVGDLFAPVQGQRFDVVLFNPPYYAGPPGDQLERAFRSPDIAPRFAAALPAHLAPGGCALVLLSSDGLRDEFLQAFQSAGLAIEVHASYDLRNEVVEIYRLSASDQRRAGAGIAALTHGSS